MQVNAIVVAYYTHKTAAIPISAEINTTNGILSTILRAYGLMILSGGMKRLRLIGVR